jgi:hypothetical protein
VLVLDMLELLPPLGLNKYDTQRILPVKCYIDNSVRLWNCIRNVNILVNHFTRGPLWQRTWSAIAPEVLRITMVLEAQPTPDFSSTSETARRMCRNDGHM